MACPDLDAFATQCDYVINAVAAWMLFGESLAAQKLIGIGFIVVGVFLVARS